MLPREFALESYFSRWEFTARYHFTASDIETMAMADLLELADAGDRARWESARLGYIETEGTPELRQAIARTYTGLEPDDILCFAGAEEGLYCAMHSLLKAGDHALVLVPNYQALESVPLTICEVSGIALDAKRQWALDLDALEHSIRPNTKLVALNFPNNPTGMNIPVTTLSAIVELCRSRGIYLFSDEVFRGVERDPAKQLPQIADVYEKGLSLNVVSKAYGLPGLRVGWIACRDRLVLARMLQLKFYLSICNAGPSEILATIAVKNRTTILSRNREFVGSNLSAVAAFFERHERFFSWYVPDGGCVAYPRYLGRDGVEQFCERLVREAGVLTLPASIFRSELLPTPDDRFRIGFGRRGLDDILPVLDTFLEKESVA